MNYRMGTQALALLLLVGGAFLRPSPILIACGALLLGLVWIASYLTEEMAKTKAQAFAERVAKEIREGGEA